MNKIIREPINAITHFFAMVCSIFGLGLLIINKTNDFTFNKIISIVIFSIGLIGLYGVSSLYHSWKGSISTIKKLEKLDHMFIYLLIAGTYTPICLVSLRGVFGYLIIAIIWSFAFAGILLKKYWFEAPRWISTGFYLILGWAALLVVYPLSKVISINGMMILFLGGIFYSIGAIFYGFKSPKVKIGNLGYHEVFHLLTMMGSLSHYIFIYKYVLSI